MINGNDVRVKLVHKYYLLTVLLLFLLSLFSGVPVFWVAFWFCLLWGLTSLAWLLFTASRLDLLLEFSPLETMRYGSVNLGLRLWNESLLPLPYNELHIGGYNKDSFTQKFEMYEDGKQVDGYLEIDDSFPLGIWGKSFQVKCLRRGYHLIGPFRLQLYTLFGALSVEICFSSHRKIAVYPRLLPFSDRFFGESAQPQETRINPGYSPFSQLDYTASYDLKPFVPGDPFKLINWKVSARQDEIYVKRPDITTGEKVMLCIEFARVYYSSISDQDLALEKIFSLVNYLLLRGFQVGIMTCSGGKRYLPAGSGKKQFLLIRKLFTGLQPESRESLLEHAINVRRAMRGRERLVWIMPNLDPGYLSNLYRLKKKGQKLSLITTDDHIRYISGSILTHYDPWQLAMINNRVYLKRIKGAQTSWG